MPLFALFLCCLYLFPTSVLLSRIAYITFFKRKCLKKKSFFFIWVSSSSRKHTLRCTNNTHVYIPGHIHSCTHLHTLSHTHIHTYTNAYHSLLQTLSLPHTHSTLAVSNTHIHIHIHTLSSSHTFALSHTRIHIHVHMFATKILQIIGWRMARICRHDH